MRVTGRYVQVSCIVACCTVLFRALSLTRKKDGTKPGAFGYRRRRCRWARALRRADACSTPGHTGADDFLPVFIYVVLRANVPRLVSNIDYIARFLSQDDMMSQYVLLPLPARAGVRAREGNLFGSLCVDRGIALSI